MKDESTTASPPAIARFRQLAIVSAVIMLATLTAFSTAYADDSTEMYRLYNPNSGEHFYTTNVQERDYLDGIGWNYEGIGWHAPVEGDDVHRLYNPNAGDHHYTMSEAEKDMLVSIGWRYEGVGWKSDTDKSIPLYRQYNPNATAGSHNYTASKAENDMLANSGWLTEGVAWYGCKTVWVDETGHFETVTVKEAWDEPVYEYTSQYCCNCGFKSEDTDTFNRHLCNHANNGERANYGLVYENAHVNIVHHDAVTEQRWVVDVPAHWE